MEDEVKVTKMTVDEHYQLLTIETENGKRYLIELIPTE
jgi:hypothetical protein